MKFSAPMLEVAVRPPMPVIFAKPMPDLRPKAPQPIYREDTQSWDRGHDRRSESPEIVIEAITGVTRDRKGRMQVVITDSKGRRAKEVS